MLQIFLSKILICDYIDTKIFYERNESILQDLTKLFDQNLKNEKNSIEMHLPEIISLYVQYETNISNLNILLDSKIYDSLNTSLTNEWEKLKYMYEI